MIRISVVTILLCAASGPAFGQQHEPAAPRPITLNEAVSLALERNHAVRIARATVDEKEATKEVARSAYFPTVRADSGFVQVTDTQLIAIPAGGLGVVGDTLIPSQTLIINQGALSLPTFGTGATQPLTQLLKVRAANDMARSDVRATQGKQQGTENSIALKVHRLYYQILIGEIRRSAVQARIQASESLQGERVQQVKYGSALDSELIESRAHLLQARQELLNTDLQLSDLRMQFNDVIGSPLNTPVRLDPNVSPPSESCDEEECIRLAAAFHPEIAEARALVAKAQSAVRLAKFEFVPDVEVFARYSHQNNAPFLAENFGTFGVRASYDVFDGGRKRALVRQRNAQLAQARENLARISEDVALRVQTAYNKLQSTRQMIAVSEELLSLRTETRRMSLEQVARGSALRSQSTASVAQELEAKAALLQSQLEYVQAADEMDEAIGRIPRR
jgi:outer membrane protein TolC